MTKLEYLDLNNVKMDNIITAHNMFKALDNLKYINLIEVQNSFQNISKTQLNKDTGLIICQSDLRITNPDAVYKCCNYNIAQGQCPFAQYMRLFFGENITYKSGFDFGTQSNKELLNDNILVIKDRKLINKNEALNITPDNIIEIHFLSVTSTLDNFFNIEYDNNFVSLKKVEFYNFDEALSNISHLFNGCKSLKSVYFSEYDTQNVTDMSYMFNGCESLISIDLSSINTTNVINMRNMFSNCSSLKEINMSIFNTGLVTNMAEMFYNCKSITTLNLSNFDTLNTHDISNIFNGCDSLKILDISNFNMINVLSYNNIISDKNNIKFLDIRNLLNDKTISNIFNETKKTLYICQSEFIIQNSHAFNCCEYIINKSACPIEDILSTFIIESTIINESTEYTEYISSEINEQTEYTSNIIISNDSTQFPTNQNTDETDKISQINESSDIFTYENEKTISNSENIENPSTNQIIETTSNQNTETINEITNSNIEKTDLTSIPTIYTTNLPSTSKNEDFLTNQYSTETNESIPITNQINNTEYSTIKEETNSINTIPNKENTEAILPYTTINNIDIANEEYNSSSVLNIGTTYLYQDEPISVVLLGFSQFKINNSSFSFYIYFTPISKIISSKQLTFPVIISRNENNTNNTVQKESVSNCTLKMSVGKTNYQYFCEIYEDTEDINQIKVIPNFNFIKHENITLVGVSPLAKMFIDNLQLLTYEDTDILFNSTVSILDNSSINENKKMLFNISGILNEPLPELLNKNLNVMINLLSDKKTQAEVNCITKKISRLNYDLYCKVNETLDADIQSAISLFEKNKILLFNFFEKNSIVKTENTPISLSGKRWFFSKNSRMSLSPAVIAALVIVLVLVTSICLLLIIFTKRREKKEKEEKEDKFGWNSSFQKINVSEN